MKYISGIESGKNLLIDFCLTYQEQKYNFGYGEKKTMIYDLQSKGHDVDEIVQISGIRRDYVSRYYKNVLKLIFVKNENII